MGPDVGNKTTVIGEIGGGIQGTMEIAVTTMVITYEGRIAMVFTIKTITIMKMIIAETMTTRVVKKTRLLNPYNP